MIKTLSCVRMCDYERNHCCGLILAIFMMSLWFKEEPMTSIRVGGLKCVYVFVYCIHASYISVVGEGLRSNDESQVQRGDV